ncbi:sensor histidine kinase [Methanoplanus endosymbiosus]|uniref:PAS domain-containing sensor histidine kinase n=1 Tax=Methanoplanus endosymbiosus TaxID=33865 RepID=A0A9E7PT02_9EURY|nr:PAS domain-containing sensor histidine kinase [Methanoplanus endosymbiosus]UUX93277.1 PAS domain-containing sensor histidine kinase [Methanoplanus endosymbiosus]
MKESECSSAEILAENERLKERLEELDEVLRAIRAGEVDAIVGTPDMGGQIFTLESAETPYRHFVENMDQGAVILDSDLTVLYCNRKFSDIIGRDIRSVIGTPACDFLTPADVGTCGAILALSSKERLSKEIIFVRPDGNRTPVHLDVGLLEETAGVRSYSVILTDLSLVKKNEIIIQAENFTRSIFENIGDAVFVCDTDYTVIRANYEAYRICNCNPVNKLFPEIMPLIIAGEESTPWKLPSPDDASNGVWSEVTLPAEGGGKMNLMVHSSRLKDASEMIIGWAIDVRDISDIRRYEETLRVANKKLNILSSITRHDILNQITVLLISLDMASESVSDPEENRENLERCIKSAETISRIISFTRNYQELGVKAPVWNNLPEIIREASLSPEFADLNVSVNCGNIEILADPMIINVFRNFFDNALRHGRASEVTISCMEKDGMVVYVEDNGPGIPSDQKEKIFGRGYGEHTGFGLFLAREILDITGSLLSETGIPGSGARFEIQIPTGAWRFAEYNS